jgi:hypothetical protein
MKPPAQHRKQDMNTRQLTTDYRQRDEHKYGLRRGLGFWELTFAGQQAILKRWWMGSRACRASSRRECLLPDG